MKRKLLSTHTNVKNQKDNLGSKNTKKGSCKTYLLIVNSIIDFNYKQFTIFGKFPTESIFFAYLYDKLIERSNRYKEKKLFREVENSDINKCNLNIIVTDKFFDAAQNIYKMFQKIWKTIFPYENITNWRIQNPYINQNTNQLCIDLSCQSKVTISTQYLARIESKKHTINVPNVIDSLHINRIEHIIFAVKTDFPEFFKQYPLEIVLKYLEANENILIEERPSKTLAYLSLVMENNPTISIYYPNIMYCLICNEFLLFLKTLNFDYFQKAIKLLFLLKTNSTPIQTAVDLGLEQGDQVSFVIPLAYWYYYDNQKNDLTLEKIGIIISIAEYLLRLFKIPNTSSKLLKSEETKWSKINTFEKLYIEHGKIQNQPSIHVYYFKMYFHFWYLVKNMINYIPRVNFIEKSNIETLKDYPPVNLPMENILKVLYNFFTKKEFIDDFLTIDNNSNNSSVIFGSYFWKPWFFKNFLECNQHWNNVFHKNLFKNSLNYQYFHYEIRKYYNHIPILSWKIIEFKSVKWIIDDPFVEFDNHQWLFPIIKTVNNNQKFFSEFFHIWFQNITKFRNPIYYQFIAYQIREFMNKLNVDDAITFIHKNLHINDENVLLSIFESTINTAILMHEKSKSKQFLFDFILHFDLPNSSINYIRGIFTCIHKSIDIPLFIVENEEILMKLALQNFGLFILILKKYFKPNNQFFQHANLLMVNQLFTKLIDAKIFNTPVFDNLEKSYSQINLKNFPFQNLNDNLKSIILNAEIDYIAANLCNPETDLFVCLEFMSRNNSKELSFFTEVWTNLVSKVLIDLLEIICIKNVPVKNNIALFNITPNHGFIQQESIKNVKVHFSCFEKCQKYFICILRNLIEKPKIKSYLEFILREISPSISFKRLENVEDFEHTKVKANQLWHSCIDLFIKAINS